MTKAVIKSIRGVILGFVLSPIFIIGGFICLIFFELHALNQIDALSEAKGMVVPVNADPVLPHNEGKLIHVIGQTKTPEMLSDPLFGVSVNAVYLDRIVEMFQWEEETITQSGKPDEYRYREVWSEHLIDTTRFADTSYKNPISLPYKSKQFKAKQVLLGAFRLSDSFINKISYYTEYELSEKNFKLMDARVQSNFRLHGHEYITGDPYNPKVGDIRIRYSVIKPWQVSVIGKQSGNKIVPYETERGNITLLEMWDISHEQMFLNAKKQKQTSRWLTRLLLGLLMWGGFCMLISPLRILHFVSPLFGNIVSGSLIFISFFVSCLLVAIATGIAWLFYKPLIGFGLIVLSVVGLATIFTSTKRRLSKDNSKIFSRQKQ